MNTVTHCEGLLDCISINYTSREGGQRLRFDETGFTVATLAGVTASQVVEHFYPDLCDQIYRMLFVSYVPGISDEVRNKLRRRFQSSKGVGFYDAVALVTQHNSRPSPNASWRGIYGKKWCNVVYTKKGSM